MENFWHKYKYWVYVADMNDCFAVPKQKICQKYLALGASTRVDLTDKEGL